MDFAINILTNEMISAFEIHKNGSYQNLTKGEWIMPQDSIFNFEECSEEDLHVHYVKHREFRNKWGTYVWVSPHFAKYPGSNAETIAESKEHKQIKDWLFTKLKNDDLQLIYSKGSKKYKFDNYVRLSELNIDWNNYNIEISTKGYKTLRVDILLQFNKKHEFLGNGIFIEIQLSPQSKKETYDRSFSRAIHGYSTAWLFKDDFLLDEEKEEFQLKEDKIKLFSFSSELKYSGKSFVKNLKIAVEEQCRYLDEKINESNYSIESKTRECIKSISTREAILLNKIKDLDENPFKSLIKKYKEDLNLEFNLMLQKVQSKTNEKISEISNIQPRIIDCPNCSGQMVFKITKLKQKELYECLRCKHIIWVK